ncbi:MAG: hypothetical protein D3923_11985 [Candidatus Electrothrix sp. AR3]|nr:hypothetical protein [Candidatus Electrothrix sp. AR3]
MRSHIYKWIFNTLLLLIVLVSPDYPKDFFIISGKIAYYLIVSTIIIITLTTRVKIDGVIFVLFLWASFFFLSALNSQNILHGLWIFYNSCLLFLALFLFIRKQDYSDIAYHTNILFDLIFYLIIIPSIVLLIAGNKIIVPLSNENFINNLPHKNTLINLSGLFLNKNTFGITLFLSACWWYFKFTENFKVKKIFCKNLVKFTISVLPLFLTLSRASIGAFFIFIFIFIFLKKDTQSIVSIFILILLITLLTAIATDEIYQSLHDRFLLTSEVGLSERGII